MKILPKVNGFTETSGAWLVGSIGAFNGASVEWLFESLKRWLLV